MANKDLNKAKAAKKDEFYTRLEDIELELKHYKSSSKSIPPPSLAKATSSASGAKASPASAAKVSGKRYFNNDKTMKRSSEQQTIKPSNHQTIKPTNQQAIKPTRWRSGEELEAYIREQRTLHEDAWHLFRSMFVVGWRNNPVQTSALAFAEELGKIGEGADPKFIALMVRQGLNAVELGSFDAILSDFSDVTNNTKDLFDVEKDYVELYPALRSPSTSSGYNAIGENFRRELMSGFGQLRSSYNEIAQKYARLFEGFERYEKIIAGGSFWKDFLLGGALGWFTGGLGVIAAVAWDNWRGMNDEDFVKNYSEAVQDFLASCYAFTNYGQELIRRIFVEKQDLWNREFARVEFFMRALNEEGVNLYDVERQLAEKEKDDFKDPDSNYALALCFDLMRQEAPISSARIDKLVQKARQCGAKLHPDGTIDEDALQSLLPMDTGDNGSGDVSAKFLAIVSKWRWLHNRPWRYMLEAVVARSPSLYMAGYEIYHRNRRRRYGKH